MYEKKQNRSGDPAGYDDQQCFCRGMRRQEREGRNGIDGTVFHEVGNGDIFFGKSNRYNREYFFG